MAELPEGVRHLIEQPNLAHMVTLMKDGSPQVTPLWVDHDGRYVLINTAEGRQKPRNIRRDPRVAISIVDRDSNYHTLQIRGRVVDVIKGDEAWQHIDKMSQKYRNDPNYPRRPGEERLLLKIEPEHVSYRAPPERR